MRYDMGDRIKTRMKEVGLTQAEVARKIQVPYSTISDWKKGVSKPREQAREKLAEVLGVSQAYLLGLEQETTTKTAIGDNVHNTTDRHEVQYWGAIPARNWVRPEGNINTITVSSRVPKEGYPAITIRGDECEPRYHHGQTVVIETTDAKINGMLSLVKTPSHGAILRILRDTDQGWVLEAINPNYNPMPFCNQCEVIGTAYGVEDYPPGGITG